MQFPQQDDPLFDPGSNAPLLAPAEQPLVLESIRALVHNEPFAVLCTQAGGQPYGSLVAVAFTADLEYFVFGTPVATRKFRLLSESPQVAMLVDDRRRFPGDFMKVSAVTVTGRASQVEPGTEFLRWAGLLASRHPYLESFVHSRTTALFRVHVDRYLHVSRFQEVREWIPAPVG